MWGDDTVFGVEQGIGQQEAVQLIRHRGQHRQSDSDLEHLQEPVHLQGHLGRC